MAGGGEKKSGDNLVVLRFQSPGVEETEDDYFCIL